MKRLILLSLLLFNLESFSSYILIPMDETQTNHLKSYGIAFLTLEQDVKVDWLLNYQGGSFMMKQHSEIENECNIRGVSYQVISDTKAQLILEDISSPSKNQEAVSLEKAPKIAVYSPKDKMPWDDAVPWC